MPGGSAAAGDSVALSRASWLCLRAPLFVGLVILGDVFILPGPRPHQNINGGYEDQKRIRMMSGISSGLLF